jgi:hypothetical protein
VAQIPRDKFEAVFQCRSSDQQIGIAAALTALTGEHPKIGGTVEDCVR